MIAATSDGNLNSGCDVTGSYADESYGATFMEGTSMATPITAGLAALVRQHYMTGNIMHLSGNAVANRVPSSALIKGILLHSGREVRYDHGFGNYRKDGHLPNFAQGFGSINLESVLGLGGSELSTSQACQGHDYDRYQCGAVGCCAWEEASHSCVSAALDPSTKCVLFNGNGVKAQPGDPPAFDVTMRVEQDDAVGTGDLQQYCVELVDQAGELSLSAPLKATLVYTDAPGNPMAIAALVNDLDLSISGPTSSWAFGNNLTAVDETHGPRALRDAVNNVEQIYWQQFEAGHYLINVAGRDVPHGLSNGKQKFALIVSGTGLTPKGLESCMPRPSCPGDGVCMHNGDCFNGTCHCRPQYSGPDCSIGNVVLSTGVTHSAHVSRNGWSYYSFPSGADWTMLFKNAKSGPMNVFMAYNRLPTASDYELFLSEENFDVGCLDGKDAAMGQASFDGVWVIGVMALLEDANLELTLDGCQGTTFTKNDCWCGENSYATAELGTCECLSCPENTHSAPGSTSIGSCVCDAGFDPQFCTVDGDCSEIADGSIPQTCTPSCTADFYGLKSTGGMSCSRGCGCSSLQGVAPGIHVNISDGSDLDEQYGDNLICEWILSGNIVLTFTRFDTEVGYDFVTVRDFSGNIIDVFTGSSATGNVPSQPLYSRDGYLRVTFESDDVVGALGFSATWTVLPPGVMMVASSEELNGEERCEGHGFTAVQCEAITCCQWESTYLSPTGCTNDETWQDSLGDDCTAYEQHPSWCDDADIWGVDGISATSACGVCNDSCEFMGLSTGQCWSAVGSDPCPVVTWNPKEQGDANKCSACPAGGNSTAGTSSAHACSCPRGYFSTPSESAGRNGPNSESRDPVGKGPARSLKQYFNSQETRTHGSGSGSGEGYGSGSGEGDGNMYIYGYGMERYYNKSFGYECKACPGDCSADFLCLLSSDMSMLCCLVGTILL